MARGTIDLFGTIFRIQKGTVTFSGDADPDLDILGVANTSDLLVRLSVTGRASAPKFALSSESGLPSDEVLARLMWIGFDLLDTHHSSDGSTRGTRKLIHEMRVMPHAMGLGQSDPANARHAR